jgi:predicted transcriptional regulator of viral defense system
MDTQNTNLSQKEYSLLENTVIKYGKIVTFDQVKETFSHEYSIEELRNRISLLSKKGWLIRLKRGLYVVITDISTLGLSDVSEYIVSQTLNKDSYISFENALQHYGMFDQMLVSVDAVTFQRARKYTVKNNKIYRFSHIKKEVYFGFTKVRINGQLVNIAEKEKALLDMLYFRSNTLTASVVLEKLQEHRQDIDFQKLKDYSKDYSLSMVREVGFLLDKLNIETDDLYTSTNVKENSYSKMTSNADTFNAKWRFYYDSKLT